MKYFASLILILFMSTVARPQAVEDMFHQTIDAHVDVVPLGFPDPAVRFGSEWMPGGRWSFGLNLGIGVPINGNSGFGFGGPDWQDDYRLFEIRPEVKLYWFKRERMGWYVAAEGFFSALNATAGQSYHFSPDNSSMQLNFDRADYQKTKFGMIGKMGGRFLLGRRMTLDFFTGLGLSQTESSYANYLNPRLLPSDPFFEGENYTIGRRLTAHISAGLRLGYILWHKQSNAATH